MYVTASDLRSFCNLTQDELPDEKANKAIEYAQGFIEKYCSTRFERPPADSLYLYDGDGSRTIFAPAEDGPWASVAKIEYLDGGSWAEYGGNWWIQGGGEWLELETPLQEGAKNWRVTGRCWTNLPAAQQELVKRACLMLARSVVLRRDEPLGPSIRAISVEGTSYSYQPIDQGHPTGTHEIDFLVRTLRRTVIRP